MILSSIIGGIHSSAITSNLASVGVPGVASCVIMVMFVVAIILDSMKSLVRISDIIVPIMSVPYLICD